MSGNRNRNSNKLLLRAAKLRSVVAIGLLAAVALVTQLSFAQDHDDPHADPHAAPTTTGHAPTKPAAAGHTAPAAHDPAAEGHAGTAGDHESGHDAASGHGGGEHGAHHGPEAINWTDLSDKRRPAFIALLVNFGLLAALYYTLGKKPIADGLKQRRVNIGKDIEEARKMLEEAKERAKKYQADLKNADADAATAKATLIAAGKGEVERMITEAEERGTRMSRDAERLVEQERKQLQQDLLSETVNAAVDQAHKLLEHGATPEDHSRLANELLAELQRKPAATRVVAATAPRGGA
jgi:F0F1-type ATP synthase membrane subunit b/b'